LDREKRWQEVNRLEKAVRDLKGIYQNRVDTLPANVYEFEYNKAIKLKEQLSDLIDTYLSDMKSICEVVDQPKTFKDKLKYMSDMLNEMANSLGCEGDEDLANYYAHCGEIVENYKSGEEEELMQVINENRELFKIEGLPKTVVDFTCSLKIDSEDFNDNIIEETYNFLKLINCYYGVNTLYLTFIPTTMNSVLKLFKLLEKLDFEIVLIVNTLGFNKRWTDNQILVFAKLLEHISSTKCTDYLYGNDTNLDFMIGASKTIVYFGHDYNTMSKIVSNNKLFTSNKNKIVRIRNI